MGWKEDVSGTGERVLRLVKLEKNEKFQPSKCKVYSHNCLQIWSNVFCSVLS